MESTVTLLSSSYIVTGLTLHARSRRLFFSDKDRKIHVVDLRTKRVGDYYRTDSDIIDNTIDVNLADE